MELINSPNEIAESSASLEIEKRITEPDFEGPNIETASDGKVFEKQDGVKRIN